MHTVSETPRPARGPKRPASPKVAILFVTQNRHTADIGRRMAVAARGLGWTPALYDFECVNDPRILADYDRAVVGAPVYRGRFSDRVVGFLQDATPRLVELDARFFGVCLAAASTNPSVRAEMSDYRERLLELSEWIPERIEFFAGKLDYPRYSFLVRLMMRRIAKNAGLSTDTSRSHIYTDWDRVDAFIVDMLGPGSATGHAQALPG